MAITLYTINCPKCKVLEKKLDAKGIKYETVTDADVMVEKGFKSAPILVVDDDVLTFENAIKWVGEQ